MRGRRHCWRWYVYVTGDTSVELEDPFVNRSWLVEAILTFLFLHFACGRLQLGFASVLPELWSDFRLLADWWDHQENVVAVFALDFLPILDET